MKKFVIFCTFVLFASVAAYSDEVHIYFLNWHYTYRSAPLEEEVRSRPHIYIKIYDESEIKRIKYFLSENLEGIDVYVYPGVYMVIDIIDNDAGIETYLLNQWTFWKKGTDNPTKVYKVYRLPEIFVDKYTFFSDSMRIKYPWW
jgi:hypothetical protein